MSLILDALNRAERERQVAEQVPNLHTLHTPLPNEQHRRVKFWVLVICFLLTLLVFGFIAYGLLYKAPNQLIPTNTKPVAAITQSTLVDEFAATAKNTERQEHKKIPKAIPAINPSVDVAMPASAEQALVSLYEQANQSPQSTQIKESEGTVTEALYQTLQPEHKVVDKTDRAKSLAKDHPETQAVIELTQPVATLAVAQARTFEAIQEVPYIGDLPWGVRQDIPTINYSRHDYFSDHPSVTINGKNFFTGDQLFAEAKLIEIFEDGIIIQYKNMPFKLKALNSWVNM